MKMKEESEKVGLKLNIQKTKIMASGSITSWQIDRQTVETVADFIFLGSKITPDGDCSQEIKRRLSNFTFTFWRRKWQPTPFLLPWKSHGQRSLVQPTIHGVAKSRAWLSNFHFTFTFTPWKESYDQPRQHIKKQRHYFANKSPSSQSYGFFQ